MFMTVIGATKLCFGNRGVLHTCKDDKYVLKLAYNINIKLIFNHLLNYILMIFSIESYYYYYFKVFLNKNFQKNMRGMICSF